MDEQDREFETFLQQFQLRQPAPFPAEIPAEGASRWRGRRWVFAAAAAAVVASLSLPLVRHVSKPVSVVATVEVAGDSKYKAGETITAGSVIRSGGFEALLVRLEDGSLVEMRAQSRIVLEAAEDDAQVRLNNGSILVRAAKQRDGHLHVKTNDTVVSGAGPLFLVESLPQGSRVAVLEGEVEVRFGTETQKVVMGQQVSSNSEIRFASIEELIAWSREVGPVKSLLVSERAAVGEIEEKGTTREATPQPVPVIPRSASGRGQTAQRGAGQRSPGPPQPAPERQQQPDAGKDDPGRQTFYRACVACHSDSFVTNRQWPNREAVADRVSRDISMGAQVSQSELPALIDYIFRLYGVKSTTGGQEVFNRACVSCHSADVARSGMYPTPGALQRRVSLDMAYGAMVSPAELPLLMDYLFSVSGNTGKKN